MQAGVYKNDGIGIWGRKIKLSATRVRYVVGAVNFEPKKKA